MKYRQVIGHINFSFPDLRSVMAKASFQKSGDEMSGLAADSEKERVAAKRVLADIPLKTFLEEQIIPYEEDEVTRLIVDTHNEVAFAEVSHMTVGDFRNWLLSYATSEAKIRALGAGLTPEMVAAVSKVMSNQDLILVASKIRNVTKFRNTLGLRGHFSTRLQPNHPADDPTGIMASTIDGLLNGVGDAVIGINPVSDHLDTIQVLLTMLDDLRDKYQIPTQTCGLISCNNDDRINQ